MTAASNQHTILARNRIETAKMENLARHKLIFSGLSSLKRRGHRCSVHQVKYEHSPPHPLNFSKLAFVCHAIAITCYSLSLSNRSHNLRNQLYPEKFGIPG